MTHAVGQKEGKRQSREGALVSCLGSQEAKAVTSWIPKKCFTVTRLEVVGMVLVFLTLVVIQFYNAAFWMDLDSKYTVLMVVCFCCSPYMWKASKYRRKHGSNLSIGMELWRPWYDMLVWTSFAYAVPGVYAFSVKQYGMSILLAGTTVGSTLFHLTRETMFFNLDNVFAMSILFICLWALMCTIRLQEWWSALHIIIFGPMSLMLNVACGLPGVICCSKHNAALTVRVSSPRYAYFHVFWHIVSGLVVTFITHFLATSFPDLEAGGLQFSLIPDLPIVPTFAFVSSLGVNLYGNYVGFMPLN